MIDSVELLKKLQVKAGMKLWLIDVPRDIAEAITAGAEVETVKGGEPCMASSLSPTIRSRSSQ
jgi:hypothetical protein